MQNYSKRVHCSECGGVFPTSETELLSVGKTVLRLCMKDYEPRRLLCSRKDERSSERCRREH
jgi:hypothetical protein